MAQLPNQPMGMEAKEAETQGHKPIGEEIKNAVKPLMEAMNRLLPQPAPRAARFKFNANKMNKVEYPEMDTAQVVANLKEGSENSLKAKRDKAEKALTPEDNKRIAVLIAQLDHEDFETREKASKDLGKFGHGAMSQLEEAIKKNDKDFAEYAEELKKARENEKEGFVKPRDIEVKRRATEILEPLRSDDTRRVEAMLRSIKGLQTYEADAIDAVMPLMRVFNEENDIELKKAAIEKLNEIAGSHAQVPLDKVTPEMSRGLKDTLLKALKDENDEVRMHAARALGHNRWAQDEVVPELIKTLSKDESFHVRSAAAGALTFDAPYGEKNMTALLDAIENDPDNVKFSATERLKSYGSNDGLDKILIDRFHKTNSPDVKQGILYALISSKRDTKETVAVLIEGLNDKQNGVSLRTDIVNALAAKRAEKDQSLKAIIETLEDKKEEKRLRYSVVSALQPLAKEPKVKEALIRGMKDPWIGFPVMAVLENRAKKAGPEEKAEIIKTLKEFIGSKPSDEERREGMHGISRRYASDVLDELQGKSNPNAPEQPAPGMLPNKMKSTKDTPGQGPL